MEALPSHHLDSNSTTSEGGADNNVSQKAATPTTISPPYWQHNRSESYASLDQPPPITLEDHTESYYESNSALWAKAVSIEDYTIVRGNPLSGGVGAYVVYNCNVVTLDGGPMIIRKRYSEFDDLRQKLAAAFPQSTSSSLPPLPPKSVIYKFRPKFLEKRRIGLSYFLNCVMLNPDYSGSSTVKDFIFSQD